MSSDARMDDTVARLGRTEKKVDDIAGDVSDLRADVASLDSTVRTGMKAFAVLMSLATIILTAVGIFYI